MIVKEVYFNSINNQLKFLYYNIILNVKKRTLSGPDLDTMLQSVDVHQVTFIFLSVLFGVWMRVEMYQCPEQQCNCLFSILRAMCASLPERRQVRSVGVM